MNIKQICLLACVSTIVTSIAADEPLKRHGAVTEGEELVLVEGGFTATIQASSDSRIKDEALTSFDLVATIPNGQGEWTAYIEGNLSPRLGGVSSVIGEVNGDAGSALDRDGKGRLQVSEFHYSRSFGENSLTIGLLNPACVLDSSAVANDETSQFLSASFVNNPTIAFPDYSLGSCFHYESLKGRPGFNLLLTSSHGLADNPNASYSELLDLDANGKGAFLGAELYWESDKSMWRIGLWSNSADHDYLDSSGKTANNIGAYLTSDLFFDKTKLNLRVGMANDEVSEAAGFVGVAVETPVAGQTLGAGIARTDVSSKAGTGKDDTTQGEIYVRFDHGENLHISPSIQLVQNSGFDNTESSFDKDLTVYSVRASYTF